MSGIRDHYIEGLDGVVLPNYCRPRKTFIESVFVISSIFVFIVIIVKFLRSHGQTGLREISWLGYCTFEVNRI